MTDIVTSDDVLKSIHALIENYLAQLPEREEAPYYQGPFLAWVRDRAKGMTPTELQLIGELRKLESLRKHGLMDPEEVLRRTKGLLSMNPKELDALDKRWVRYLREHPPEEKSQ